MRTKSYVINQRPATWRRPDKSGVRLFEGVKRDKAYYQITLESQHNQEPLFTKATSIEIKFYMATPNNIKARYKKTSDKRVLCHIVPPDSENLERFLLDVMKGVLISDESIIYHVEKTKMYDDNPRTEFTLIEI